MEKVLSYLAKLEAQVIDMKIKKSNLQEQMEVAWNKGRKHGTQKGELMPKEYMEKYNTIHRVWEECRYKENQIQKKINVIKEMLNEISR